MTRSTEPIDSVADCFTATFATTIARPKYKAISAKLGALVQIGQQMVEEEILSMVGRVKIVNTTLTTPPEYYGVVLESRATLAGAGNVTFRDDTVNDGKDTVPEDKKIVVKTSEQALVIP